MSEHKYWRVYVDNNNGDPNQTFISELEFRAVPGGADQCSGGTAFAESQTSIYGGHRAFDNMMNDIGWMSEVGHALNTWVGYSFAAPVAVGELAMWGVDTQFKPSCAPKDFRVQYSDDGVVWTDYFTITDETDWAYYEMRTFIPQLSVTISGIVTLDNAPHPATVRAYLASDGVLSAETIADPGDGSYTLTGLDADADYYVMAIDGAGVRPLVHGPVQGV